MDKIVVIDGHPDPDPAHLVHALADRYVQAAREAGGEVRRITVAELDFPLLRVPADFFEGEAPPPIRAAQDDLRWADHAAFFYPLWMGDMPATLKAFIEQTLRPGLTVEFGAGPFGLPKRLFTGKSARIVVTMGMPPALYRTLFGAHAVKAFAALLRFGGVRPVRVTLLGGMRENGSSCAERWLDTVAALAADDVTRHGRRFGPAPVVAATLLLAGAAVAVRVRSRR